MSDLRQVCGTHEEPQDATPNRGQVLSLSWPRQAGRFGWFNPMTLLLRLDTRNTHEETNVTHTSNNAPPSLRRHTSVFFRLFSSFLRSLLYAVYTQNSKKKNSHFFIVLRVYICAHIIAPPLIYCNCNMGFRVTCHGIHNSRWIIRERKNIFCI